MRAPLPELGIGIDIGGTSTKAAVIDSAGGIVASATAPTRGGVDGVTATALDVARRVIAEAGLEIEDVEAIGVGVPGTVDPVLGTVRFAVNVGLNGEHLDLAARLAQGLGATVHVENDVRAAALGADWYLARTGTEVNDLAYLSIGTGIAAGYVEHGRLRRGAHLVAGEIGHIPVDPAGPECACGQTGCIEAIASGAAIERMWPTPDGASAIALERAARAGDRRAVALWAGVITGLSRAVLMLALTFDPEIVVLGGGVATLGQPLHDAIAARLAFDGRHSEFLGSLGGGERLRIIDPLVPLGPIGAILAANAASAAAAVTP